MRALLLISVLAITAGVMLSVQETRPALAAHHIAEISEVMVGFDGDPNVQYVEINMQSRRSEHRRRFALDGVQP